MLTWAFRQLHYFRQLGHALHWILLGKKKAGCDAAICFRLSASGWKPWGHLSLPTGVEGCGWKDYPSIRSNVVVVVFRQHCKKQHLLHTLKRCWVLLDCELSRRNQGLQTSPVPAADHGQQFRSRSIKPTATGFS